MRFHQNLSILTIFVYKKFSKMHYGACGGVVFKGGAVFKRIQYSIDMVELACSVRR